MLRNEFEIRTGIYPPVDFYRIIEKYYNATNADKDDFCRDYKENTDGLAERIQCEAEKAAFEKERSVKLRISAMEKELEDLKRQLERIQKELDREQEWKPRGVLSEMEQKDYEELVKMQDTRFLSEQEAKDWIERECGFCSERIRVIRELCTYDINRHRMLRKSGVVQRAPVYFSTDWNYVRFDCSGWQYEMVNGELKLYCD